MKHIHTFESFLNENYRTATGEVLQKFMLLIWDANGGPMPELLMAFTSDREADLDIPKGELADMIEKSITTKIDPDDFEAEVISTKDFLDDYASPRNPNRINVNQVRIEYMNEGFLNEGFKDNREIVADNPGTFIDVFNFLKRGMGYEALKKACKGKIPYTIFLQDKTGFPKPGGMYLTSISFMADGPNPSMSVEEFIDVVNNVLTDHGYDKYKVEIKK